jgi:hypothetical protein
MPPRRVASASQARSEPTRARLPASPFENITYEQAGRLVPGTTGDNAFISINHKFYDGDHWQAGAGWIGPRPSTTDADAAATWALLESGFTSANKIREVVDRHRNGVVGTEPTWAFTSQRIMKQDEEPNEQEKSLMREAEAALTEWWDNRNIPSIISEAIKDALLGRRGVVRMFVPRGLLLTVAGGEGQARPVRLLNAIDLRDALAKLYIEAVQTDAAAVYTDQETQAECGVFKYTRENDPIRDNANTGDFIELTYLNAEGNTVIRVIGQDDKEQKVSLAMGGAIMMHQVERPELITEQVRELQRALNLALSVIPRTVVSAGFLERVITNAQTPGNWVDDPTMAGGKRFVPAPYYTGPATTNFVQGIPLKKADGSIDLTTPGITFREPTEVTGADQAKDSLYQCILDEVHQAHVMIVRDATPSGHSREEARADFEKDLATTALEAVALVRWIVVAALGFGEAATRSFARFTSKLRATAVVAADAGPISADERRANDEAVSKGNMSRSTNMERAGILDVDAEMLRINVESVSDPEVMQKRANTVTLLVGAETTIEAAAEVAGFSEEQIELLSAGAKQARKQKEKETKMQMDNEMKIAKTTAKLKGSPGAPGMSGQRAPAAARRGAKRPTSNRARQKARGSRKA